MKINWNGFLKEAIENYPNESCAFLFTNKPYSPDEEWTVFSVKNVSKTPKEEWIPDRNEMIEVKRKATKLGLIKIGNIHTHPYAEEFDIGEQKLPSPKDLFFARRFNDIVRGILVIGKGMILACHLHDKFGREIPVFLDGKDEK